MLSNNAIVYHLQHLSHPKPQGDKKKRDERKRPLLAKFSHRCLAATECLADCLRPLVDGLMPAPFCNASAGHSIAMVVRARLDFVHQFCEARAPLSRDPALQMVVCPACGHRTPRALCERCACPLDEVKAAWAAACSSVSR